MTDLDDLEPTEIADVALPLDAWHRARGARMVSFAGYVMPIQYEGIMAEHMWTRTHAGLFDVSHMGQVSVTGDGADAALEAILPGEIQGLGAGRMRYSLLMAADGGILDDLMVTRRADDLYLVVNGACKYDDLAYMREELPDEVTINHLENKALLALQGPEAGAVMAAHLPDTETLYFMQARAFTLDGMDLWISRSGYTGEDGFEISVDADDAEKLANLLTADDRVKPIGLGARDSLRLEAGLPLYGHDLDPATGPVGAGLTFAIQKRRREQGGFAGHGTVMQEFVDGPATKRVGFSIEGRMPAREGAEIFVGDDKVGVLTSGGFAPTVNAPIAMGWIDASHAADGTPVEIEVRGKRIAAKVAAMPFVPHNYYRQPKA